MENMQDILKKYYASGGKDLFKEQDDDANMGVNPHSIYNGPSYSLTEIIKTDPGLLEKLKTQWFNEVPDDTKLDVRGKQEQTKQFAEKLESIRFRNYSSRDEFDDSESFLLELLFYKYCPDLNEFGPDANQYLGGRQPPVDMKRKGFMSGLVPTIYPCIELVVVSSAAYFLDVKMILRAFKDFMEKDHAERNLPREYGKVQFYKGTTAQGNGARAVQYAAKQLGMPSVYCCE